MEYKEFLFGDFAKFKYGKMPDKKRVSKGGKYPIFSGYRIVGTYDEYNIEEGQLVIVARGVGGTGDVKLSPARCFLTNLSIVAEVDERIARPKYLYYLYKLKNLRYLDSGSAQSQITISDLQRLKVTLPDIKIQDKIIVMLEILDRKIALNEEINKNLEEQARTIYQNMFVENISQNQSKGILSDIANITMGQSPKGETYNEDGLGTVFFQGRGEFGDRFPTRRLFTTDPKRMAQANDVLISVRAPVGDVNVAYEPCCIGRGLGAISSKDYHQSFVLYTVLALRKKFDVFNGDGTIFGSVNKNDLNSMSILIPSKAEMDSFEELVAPIDATIRNNYEETSRIKLIRDSLLPRLLSGEIDLSSLDI